VLTVVAGAGERQWEVREPWRLRPQLVLVLSGGGARGIAQVGVLQVLEREGIVPDAVVGTSFGAIVGGLYAAGYTAAELEEILQQVPWDELLALSEQERPQLFVDQRQEEDRSLVTFYFDNFRPVLPLAISSGSRVTAFLQALLWRAPYRTADFDRLRCRFRAVATDLVRGQTVVLRSGDLAVALHASTVFPLRYTPVLWDSLVLVDGGLEANLPVRLARREFPGALIVAVNTTAPLREAVELLSSPWALADQSVSVLMQRFVEQDRAAADVLIEPDLGNWKTLEFRNLAELVVRGYRAAEEALPELRHRIRCFWDSLARSYLGADTAGVVVRLRLEGFTAEDERALMRVRGMPLVQAVAELLRRAAEGTYEHLWLRVDAAAGMLECAAQAYRGGLRVELWGVPTPVAELIERQLPAFSTSPVLRPWWEWQLRRVLVRLGYNVLQPVRWVQRDSCVEVFLEPERVRSVECVGVGVGLCRELQGLLQLKVGQPLLWEDFWQRWQQLQNSGVFRGLGLQIWYADTGAQLRMTVQRQPPQRVHVGLRSDNERYTRLWVEAVHRQGISRQWQVRTWASAGPRDVLAGVELSLQRAFPELWAAIRGRLYGESRLVRLFEERLQASGWDVLVVGDVRQQRLGSRLEVSLPFQPVAFLEGWLRWERQREGAEPFATVFLWGVQFVHDNRDRAEFAHRGQLVRIGIEGTVPGLKAVTGFTRAWLVHERAFPVGGQSNVWFAFEFGAGDATLPALELFALGGLQSFLGMRAEEQRGRQLLRASVAYFLPSPVRPLGMATRLFLRYDIGSVWLLPEQIRLQTLRHSLGGGVVLETPLGDVAVAVGKSFRFLQSAPVVRSGPTLVSFTLGSMLP
jgi:NTE family protein